MLRQDDAFGLRGRLALIAALTLIWMATGVFAVTVATSRPSILITWFETVGPADRVSLESELGLTRVRELRRGTV